MIHEILAKVGHLFVPALAGAVLGWAGTALTLVGRVDAIEKSQQRVESLLVHYIEQQQEKHAQASQATQGGRR